jgi:hypothetical protein
MPTRLRFLVACLLAGACAVGTATNEGDDAATTGNDASMGSDTSKPGTDAGVDAPKTCTSPTVACADAGCVDLTSDPNHCGGCTTVCTTADASALQVGSNDNPASGIPGFMVEAGAPWSVGTASCATSSCGVTCPMGLTVCSDGICYDTQNFHDHCGSCTTACAPTEYCAGGHCCVTGQEYCGASCVDVLANNANCGGCGVTCTGSQTCSGAKCITCGGTNVALTATATTSSGGVTTYGPQNANDNILETAKCSPYSWISTSGGSTTEWIQYTWTTSHTLTKVHMDTAAFSGDSCGLSGYTVTGAEVQWWNGTAWVTDGTVSGETNDWDYTFTAPVTTTQVRLYSVRSPSGQNAFIFEWQVFGC